MAEQAIWWIEERLLDLYETLTGRSNRKELRAIVLTISFVCMISGNATRLIRSPDVIGGIAFAVCVGLALLSWYPRWIYPKGPFWHLPLAAHSKVAIRQASRGLCILVALWLFSAVFFDFVRALAEFAFILMLLSDFILWADVLNRPRKPRESLPGRLRKLFAVYNPALSGARG